MYFQKEKIKQTLKTRCIFFLLSILHQSLAIYFSVKQGLVLKWIFLYYIPELKMISKHIKIRNQEMHRQKCIDSKISSSNKVTIYWPKKGNLLHTIRKKELCIYEMTSAWYIYVLQSTGGNKLPIED